MRRHPALPIALATLLLTGACAYDDAIGYAPEGYPPGYDSGMGSGLVTQPGDLFGGQNVASVAVFDAPLAPYGQWVDSRFGRAFRPDAPQGWRPYVNGRWGENRIWISDDPWGWATDHYGRWGFDDRIGWVWVPGTEWAPSWVAFRDDPAQNVTGWAPIPPNVSYSLNFGFGTGWGYDSYDSWYGPSWVWVPRSYLYQPGFGGRVLPWSYGANYWGGSRWQYQPGWGGRPHERPVPTTRPPGGDWQGRPQNDQWQGRPREGGYANGRPPQGGSAYGRPPQGGQAYIRPPQGGQWNGQPGNGQPAIGGNWGGRPPEPAQGNVEQHNPGNPQYRGQNRPTPAGDAGIPGFQAWQGHGETRNTPAAPRSEAPRPVVIYEAPRPMPAPQPQQQARPEPRYEPQRMERPATPERAERSHEDTRNVRPE